MKHWRLLPLILSAVGLSFGSTLFSSHPAEVQATSDDYYASINWSQSGATLKTALCNLIHSHTNVGYSGLWNVYKTSDVRSDGCIWDMYSDNTNYAPGGSAQGASYKQEGDSYNREHTIPQSVFNEASPMKADAFHVYPTDGYVNNRRGTYPHADVGSVTWASHNNFVKIGTSSDAGISGTVCEVADEYKGDFARTYFYFVTCYQNEMKSRNWGSYAPFNYSSALGLNDAYLAVYLKQYPKKKLTAITRYIPFKRTAIPLSITPKLSKRFGATIREAILLAAALPRVTVVPPRAAVLPKLLL